MTEQAAQQLQRRFGITAPTAVIDAAELDELREKAARQDAIEAALSATTDNTDTHAQQEQS